MRFCLDAWAVLAWLDGEEPAATHVDAVFGEGRPAMSWINLVEVEHRLRRDHGADEASSVVNALRPTIVEELPRVARMREVARLKSEHPIALADCFAIATAAAAGATLLTGDPEIVERADRLPCAVLDVRA